MSFPVRIYGYLGLARVPVTNDGGTAGQDSVYVLEQGYLWNQVLTTNGVTSVVSTVAAVPPHRSIDSTKLLRVEVPDGQSIRYEITRDGTAPTATTNSPLLTGRDQIMFGPGWLLAVIDASGT